MIEIEARLSELRTLGLHSRMRLVSGPQGPHVVLDGKPVLLLCSDNYLGLADHPRVREAAADAAMRWGVSAGASRLASGTMTVHRRLEERLAAFKRRDSALLFGSRFLANAGVIAALARPGDVVLLRRGQPRLADRRLPAVARRGVRLRPRRRRASGLGPRAGAGARRADRHRRRCSRSDGDVAPLEDIVELAQRHRVRLLVDEAHGIGTLGPGGRGALAELGLEDQVDVIVGTLGKALGSHGAFVACDRVMTQYLLNAARTLIFSTAPPPPAVAGALAALDLLEERPRLVEKLHVNAAALRARDSTRKASTCAGPPPTSSRSWSAIPSSPCSCPSGALARRRVRPGARAADASRPPARCVRLAVMASHRAEELRAAAGVLARAARAVGFDPRLTVAFDEPAQEAYDPEPVDPYEVAPSGDRSTTSRSRARPETRSGRQRPAAAAGPELLVVGLEVPLARPAHGTEPRLGDVLERRAGRDAPVGIALGRVIDEPARSADPFHPPKANGESGRMRGDG